MFYDAGEFQTEGTLKRRQSSRAPTAWRPN